MTRYVTAMNQRQQHRRRRRHSKTRDSSPSEAVKENKRLSPETETRSQTDKHPELPFVGGDKALRCQVTHSRCSQTESESGNSADIQSHTVAIAIGSGELLDGDKIGDQLGLFGCRYKQICRYAIKVKLRFFLAM